MNDLIARIVSITELRRNFGGIADNLAVVESLVITKDGEPFATLKSTPNIKAKLLKKMAGTWKNTPLDNDFL